MTYAEAIAIRDAIEDSLLSGAGIQSVQIGDRQITYSSEMDARRMLNQLNRDILAYERRQSNINPEIRTPRWK